jgi:hypothetical protein
MPSITFTKQQMFAARLAPTWTSPTNLISNPLFSLYSGSYRQYGRTSPGIFFQLVQELPVTPRTRPVVFNDFYTSLGPMLTPPPATLSRFTPLPAQSAWRLLGVHDGFEIVRFAPQEQGLALTGVSLGIEKGIAWHLRYCITLDTGWHTQEAVIETAEGIHLHLETDGAGHWMVNGHPRHDLEGCLDVDLKASVMTNTVPIHRLALEAGQLAGLCAAYVRTETLQVERLEQSYQRIGDTDGLPCFDYQAPRFGYHQVLRFGSDGLIIDYPGIGSRVQG